MNFRKLSEAFLNGSSDTRHSSSIEYKSLSGAKFAPGMTSQQMTFTAKGNGVLEFFRRGSFMERGSAFPGLWKSQCDAADLVEAWKKLGDLGPYSFPARVADPGDTISSLSAYVSGQVETLTWGPPDPNVRAPGQEFLIALAPLMNLAAEGEITWAVEMAFAATRPTTGGISISLTFRNPGKIPIGILSSLSGPRGGFTLRYALDRDAPPGVTPLPVEWNRAKLAIPEPNSAALINLIPGNPVSLWLHADVQLEPGRRYIGKIQYEQIQHLDSIAGIPILSGSCFTEVFEFQT